MNGESKRTDLMGALDLILDVAYHDGSDRDLAVAAEAYTLVGFHDAAINVTHAGHDVVQERVRQARKGRPRRLLRADARGMVAALSVLIDEGFIDCRRAWMQNNKRWNDRGGYDFTASVVERERASRRSLPSAQPKDLKPSGVVGDTK